jgi:hypothetical protein
MKKPLSSLLCTLAVFFCAVAPVAAADLSDGFENPPDSAKPRTWWHWVGGNISSQGITADLEAMKNIGLAGAQIFTVDQTAVRGPVTFMSPEWRQMVHQALAEGDRLHLEMAMEDCEGWSESGGPWIKPEQSMQQVVWSEAQVAGGQKIALTPPQPPTMEHYYEDIALLAFPRRSGDDLPDPVNVTSNSPGFDGTKVIDHDYATQTMLANKPPGPFWIQLDYDHPITCRGINLQTERRFGFYNGELQASDDGVTFKRVAAPICICGGSSFPAVTAKYFRVYFAKGPSDIPVKEVRMIGARIDRWEQRTGLETAYPGQDVPFVAMPLTSDEVIDPATIVDLTGKKEWDAPAGNWTILRIGHTSTGIITHPAAVRGLESDKMNRDDVAFHFQHMFDPVFQDSPALIGTSLRYVLLDSWEAGCENWTPLMRDEFKKRHGYDLWPWLATLTGRIVGDADVTQRFLWDYRRTLADLVAENHYGTIQELAHEHHLGVYAEAVGINMQTVADQLQCKGRTDIPMGEFWVRDATFDNIDDPREAASAAHIYGQNIAATESYTAQPTSAAWTNDPHSMKALGDMEFCNGINRFVFHRYAHQPWLDREPGMSMGPYGINFERTNTWWTQGKAWISYISRCQYLLQQGRFVADLCYFYGEGAPMCIRHKNLRPEVPAGYDYDVCNAEILLHQMSVENGEIVLKSGMHYRVLVLPELDRMTLPVLQKVADLVKAGATVYGPRPTKTPSLEGYPQTDQTLQTLAQEVWGDCDGVKVTHHADGQGKIAWGEPLDKLTGEAPDFSSTQNGMLSIHRRDGDADIYFVSNQQPQECVATCTFRVDGKIPELWHPDTGERETVALYNKTADGRTSLPIHFDPVGSVFVIFRQPESGTVPLAALQRNGQNLFAGDAAAPANPPSIAGGQIELTAWQPGSYQATGPAGKTWQAEVPPLPAPLTLDGSWELTFPPNREAPPQVTLDHLISWTDSPDDGVKYFSGTATYKKEITVPTALLGEGHRIFLDLGEIKNLAEVILNGKDLGILWKPPFRVEVTSALHTGPNQLEVKVTNLWPNRLIGDQKVPEIDRTTWASVSLYKADSPLLPSGLLGPVQLIPAAQVILAPK